MLNQRPRRVECCVQRVVSFPVALLTAAGPRTSENAGGVREGGGRRQQAQQPELLRPTLLLILLSTSATGLSDHSLSSRCRSRPGLREGAASSRPAMSSELVISEGLTLARSFDLSPQPPSFLPIPLTSLTDWPDHQTDSGRLSTFNTSGLVVGRVSRSPPSNGPLLSPVACLPSPSQA